MPTPDQIARVAKLESDIKQLGRDVDAERAKWDEIQKSYDRTTETYKRAAESYAQTSASYERAQADYANASVSLLRSAEASKAAEGSWQAVMVLLAGATLAAMLMRR